MDRKSPAEKVIVTRENILRAVASSSGIETGENTAEIEKRLKPSLRRFSKLTLSAKS